MGTDKEGLIFLHGLSGSETIFDGLAAFFAESHNICCPTLLGHDESLPLGKVSSRDWLSQIEDLPNNAAAVVGVSFGASLACIYAAKHKPKKLVLVAPPFCLRSSLDEIYCLFASRLPECLQELQPRVVRGTTNYPLSAVTRSVKLRRQAVRLISKIESEVLVVFDTFDHLVEPIEVIDVFARKTACKLKIELVPGSGHSMLADERAVQVVREFLKE